MESTSKTAGYIEELRELKDIIHIKGATANNLKNVEVKIPKNQLIVVTGLSGSGKSSLIMDTLYAEGQMRYVESLSSYARQFLSRMKKPPVDFIKGVCPAIAIEQKVTTSNSRSTVGSLTEIYDYLRLLFARVGVTYSPVSGKEVTRHTVTDVVDFIMGLPEKSKVQILYPLNKSYADRTLAKELEYLEQKGYSRIYFEESIQYIEDFTKEQAKLLKTSLSKLKPDLYILVDRLTNAKDQDNLSRMGDSIQTALYEGAGEMVALLEDKSLKAFNNRFELDGMTFVEPSHQLFNYNNPHGACPTCEGYGKVLGIDRNKVIPNEELTVYEGAIICWNGDKSSWFKDQLIVSSPNFDFPIHRPIKDLTKKEYQLLWDGNEYFDGISSYFAELEKQTYKIQNRVMLARFRGRTTCHTCQGSRLRPESLYVKIADTTIADLVDLPIDELSEWFEKLELTDYQMSIGSRILTEIRNRLGTMMSVGLPYLTINRMSSSLSGGETQRINLTRTLGSNLTNSLYILDEPSIGLHPKDTTNLVRVLYNLRDLRNTVIVVEHEEEVIKAADHIVDVGPEAGKLGGEIVFSGSLTDFIKKKSTGLTAKYLKEELTIDPPTSPRSWTQKLELKGARQNNLKDIDVTFPINIMTVVSGVSGSGKSTLVRDVLFPALSAAIDQSTTQLQGKYTSLEGDHRAITTIEYINQSPIGRSSRSNPVTYIKAYDAIRKLYSSQQSAKIKGFKPNHFSFNTDGGRCENCLGDGYITVEMQFLADVQLVCEDCNGKKFKEEVLDVTYKDKNIFDVLSMTVDESIEFFSGRKEIFTKIKPLQDVGMGYVTLGQPSSTLSGGEAQRVKLASFLVKQNSSDKIFFIFDEPTTGLHFHDVKKLLKALNALVERGHTVLIVEHNLEVIKSADWLIELGPEGGKLGGHLVFQGIPKDVLKCKKSATAPFLKGKL